MFEKLKIKNIALHDSDNTNFPNLVLMKLSRYHKDKGDTIYKFRPIERSIYDIVYSSKVFTFTKVNGYIPKK